MIKTNEHYSLLLNPYSDGSMSSRIWDKWAVRTAADRAAFVRQCEAAPAGIMHGATAAEWDIVSKMPLN